MLLLYHVHTIRKNVNVHGHVFTGCIVRVLNLIVFY